MINARIHRLAAVAVACTMVIAACGSDDTASDASVAASTADVATPTTQAPATTEAPTEITDVPATEVPDATDAVPTTDAASPSGSISEVATAAGATFVPSYTAFAPGYDAAINGDDPVTAIMPSDEGFIAFSAQYPNLTNEMRADFEALDNLLRYHVIEGAQLVEAMATGTDLISLQGEPITVEVNNGVVVLNGGQATITTADLEAANGVVHVIDGILLPPSLAATAS